MRTIYRFMPSLVMLGLVKFTYAAQALPSTGIDTFDEFVGLICKAGNWFFTVVMALAILVLLFAGLLFLTGGSNPANIEKAKKTLIYAIVGIGIAIMPKAIIAIVSTMLQATGSTNPCP